MFRKLAEEGSKLGIKAKEEYWGKGKLVPDEITIKLVEEMLSKPEYEKGVILDGFPRTIEQAKAFDELMNKDYLVINLDVSEETLLDRATGRRVCKKCGTPFHIRNVPPKVEGICDECGGELEQREDSKPEMFKERLKVYEEQTKPLLDFYGDRVLNVDGEGTPQPIFERTVEAIEKALE
jgi:adenylate kinase